MTICRIRIIQQPCNPQLHPIRGFITMPSAVWSGHLHFGLVVMPIRLLVAARTKTTRFRRLYRKPVNENLSVTSFPSFWPERGDHDSDFNEQDERTRSTPVEMKGRRMAQ